MTSPSRTDADPTGATVNPANIDITAGTDAPVDDDRAEIDRRVAAWEADFKPRDRAERSLILQAATLEWQIDCAVRETSAKFDPSPAAEKLRRHLASLRREHRATIRDFWNSRKEADRYLDPSERLSKPAPAREPAPRRQKDVAAPARPLEPGVVGVIPRVSLDLAWTEEDEDRARLQWLEDREAPLRKARIERFLRERAEQDRRRGLTRVEGLGGEDGVLSEASPLCGPECPGSGSDHGNMEKEEGAGGSSLGEGLPPSPGPPNPPPEGLHRRPM